MSIYFDFKVGPKGRRFRKAVDQDKTEIEAFWDRQQTMKLFNVEDIGLLIERSTLSIVMINEDMKVLGFVAMTDHPNIPALDPAHWELWIRNMFQKFYLSRDTLFIDFICCHESVNDYFLDEAFASVFLNDFYLKYIVLVVSPACEPGCVNKYPPYKRRTAYQYCAPKGEDKERNFCHYLYVAERKDFCPKMKVRRAVEEDNDDIVEILNDECPQLIEMYGEYYISEIIARHPECQRKVIVSEIQEKIAGVMCLSADVNYSMLQSTYELAPYNGLVRPSREQNEEIKRNNELLTAFGDPILLGQLGPFDHITRDVDMTPQTFVEDNDEPSAMKLNISTENNLNLQRPRNTMQDDSERPQKKVRHSLQPKTHEQNRSWDISHDYSLSLLMNPDVSVSILLSDDDSFEYDIVNIDAELMQAVDMSLMDLRLHSKISETSVQSVRPRYSVRRRSTYKRRSLHLRQQSEVKASEIVGEPNVFIIELLGLSEQVDVRRSFELLEAAFECMQNYDYCAIRVPAADKSLFLLQHFTFVPTKNNICSKYSLYIAHRSSVLGKLRVRRAEYGDVPQIASLLHNLDAKETLWTIEYSISHPRQHISFVFLCGCSIIGVAILEPPEEIQFLREEFSLENYHMHKYHLVGNGWTSGFASIKSALIYPAFEPHFRFFMRELMRLSGSSSVVWLTPYRNKLIIQKANTMVASMIPVMPRKGGMEFYKAGRPLMSFNVWMMSKKMTSLPKLNVNCRIVVVGASRTALGFLNALLFDDACPYLTFTNVTLVAPTGLPYSRHLSKPVEMMFPLYRTSRNEYIKNTPYTYYVNVNLGTLVDIDKQGKFITIDNGKKLYYDLLFILCGKQYQHPDYLNVFTEKSPVMKKTKNHVQYIRMDVPRTLSDVEIDPLSLDFDIPENVFIVNTPVDAMKSLNYVKNLVTKDLLLDGKILVYGASIHVYCCMSALIEIGVPPENIVFAEPFPPENQEETRVPVFCNVNVDKSVFEIIKSLNIQTYRGYYFQSWRMNEARLITSVELLSYIELVHVECVSFFYYNKKFMDAHAYVAIQKSGLAYDGGILIDHRFRTNNPSIYAAGTVTRYYRRYFADDKRQGYYDTYEVGYKLGEQIRNDLDPMLQTKPEDIKENPITKTESPPSSSKTTSNSEINWKLPELKLPVTWYCTFPGGLNYLEVRPPGIKYPSYYVQSLNFNGFVMETFKHGYFKLHMTKEYVVDGITCLTPEPYILENFKSLYGLSGEVLNHVHLRFFAHKIDDFFEFFTAPWAAFLYHERVGDLMAMVKELRPKNEPDGPTLQEILCKAAAECNAKLPDLAKVIRRECHFEKSQYFSTIADYVIEWLAENDDLMHMYLQPWQIVEYYNDLAGHPAFKRRKRNFRYMLKEIIKDFRLVCR